MISYNHFPIVLYFIIADDSKIDETVCIHKKLKFYLNININLNLYIHQVYASFRQVVPSVDLFVTIIITVSMVNGIVCSHRSDCQRPIFTSSYWPISRSRPTNVFTLPTFLATWQSHASQPPVIALSPLSVRDPFRVRWLENKLKKWPNSKRCSLLVGETDSPSRRSNSRVLNPTVLRNPKRDKKYKKVFQVVGAAL